MFCPRLSCNSSWVVLRSWIQREPPETIYFVGKVVLTPCQAQLVSRWRPVPAGKAEGSAWPGRLDGGHLISTDHSIGLAVLLNMSLPLSGLRTKGKMKYPNVLSLGTGHTKKQESKWRWDKAHSCPCPALQTTSVVLQLTADFSWRRGAAQLSPLRSRSSWWVTEMALSSLSEGLLWIGMARQGQLIPTAATASLLQFVCALSLSKTLLARLFWL